MSANSSRDVLGVIVTLQGTVSNGCLDGNGTYYDFYSRYFAPWVGIPEDPVTGKLCSLNLLSQVHFICYSRTSRKRTPLGPRVGVRLLEVSSSGGSTVLTIVFLPKKENYFLLLAKVW